MAKEKRKSRVKRFGAIGAALACALTLFSVGCQDITSVTPSVFLPPLAWCTPVPGSCVYGITADLTGTINGTPYSGSTTLGDPDNFNWSGPDQVFSFTLCNTRHLNFSTCGTAWDTVLMLRDNDCQGETLNNPGSPQEDDGCGSPGGPSKFSATLPPGLYHLILDGYGGAYGNFTITITTP